MGNLEIKMAKVEQKMISIEEKLDIHISDQKKDFVSINTKLDSLLASSVSYDDLDTKAGKWVEGAIKWVAFFIISSVITIVLDQILRHK